MLFRQYGVSLRRLDSDSAEQLRQWRNADHIRRHMRYREIISAEGQQDWFRSIDNESNHYFIIETAGQAVGMIHCAEIDWKNREGQAGLFIHDQSYWNSPVPVAASLGLLDLFLRLVGLETLHAIVLKGNEAAMRYNAALGFQSGGLLDDGISIGMKIDLNSYRQTAGNLHRAFRIIAPEPACIELDSRRYPGKESFERQLRKGAEIMKIRITSTGT